MNNTGKLKPFVPTRSDLRNIAANVIGATVGCFDNSSYYVCYPAAVIDVDDNENTLRLNTRTRTVWKKEGSFGGSTGNTTRHQYPRDPMVTDDVVHGFATFDEWLNTVTGNMFICTNSAATAADWKQIQYVYL